MYNDVTCFPKDWIIINLHFRHFLLILFTSIAFVDDILQYTREKLLSVLSPREWKVNIEFNFVFYVKGLN